MELNLEKITAAIKRLLPQRKLSDIDGSSKTTPMRNGSLSFKLNDPFITNLRDEEIRSKIYDQRSRVALEASAAGIWDWDIPTNVVFYSSESLKLLGLDSNDVFDNLELWDRALHPEDLHKYYAAIDNHLDGKTSYFENQHRVLTSNGKYKWIMSRGKVIECDSQGKPLRLAGTHTDIYFQKERELTLIRNSKFFASKKR
ncbi:hypothetical protein FLA105534_01928 [Flavobacterium bizetiae]|uniref:histidine kinase n=1 Tax=Flavobacterium bizetiae TaxID=2704140 RepID=A0A6J4GIB4_9FLAO|nr:PAS domain-containing protein [Flavobacterium bizetiae]CAA9198030.1 hypothetical protein FLA105534_01928 [Flavobacterium bizetiae]CAD5340278.1 hypothetical protein FLA105535_00232 [Flavobacterium bizetiae]CAD5346448.1 hypothetical protein FLA105534_00389 [Flavobacterium bizetiae]